MNENGLATMSNKGFQMSRLGEQLDIELPFSSVFQIDGNYLLLLMDKNYFELIIRHLLGRKF